MSSFGQRVVGAMALRAATYEEVEADTTATGQAMAVVVLASVASGVTVFRFAGLKGLIGMTLVALAIWFIRSGVIATIGTKILPEPQTSSNTGELLRVLGFASSPGLLMVVGIVPFIGPLLGVIVWFWMLAATVIAVRQALDYEGTGRAVVVCLIGFFISYLLRTAIRFFLGLGGLALAF